MPAVPSTPGSPSPEALARHPHLGEPRTPGRVRVDLHSHTMWSGDSTTTPDEVLAAVAASGLDVVCITDHHAIAGAERLGDALAEVGCRVVVGEEIRTTEGELIGLFLTERIPFGLTPEATAAAIRAQGGVVYVPHPYDPMRRCLSSGAIDRLAAAGLIDAMEGRNAKTSLEHLNRRACDAAAAFDVAVGAGSDAHVPNAFGAAYAQCPDFDGPVALVAALRHPDARIVGHHWDEARPWTPRIIPSTKG